MHETIVWIRLKLKNEVTAQQYSKLLPTKGRQDVQPLLVCTCTKVGGSARLLRESFGTTQRVDETLHRLSSVLKYDAVLCRGCCEQVTLFPQ